MDILIFADYYLPSYKAGGPIRSLSSLIEALGDEIRFHLVTRDRDLSDEEPFFGLSPDGWKKVGKAEVLYCAPGRRGRQAMRRAVCDRSWDLVYVNSLFSPTYSILPLVWWRIGRLRSKLFVIAPKGECHPGALAGKARKKALFLRMARLFGLHRHVRWHASTSQEANDIASSLRLDLLQRADIGIAPDIPLHLQGDPSHTPAEEARRPKERGSLNVIFLSRITPMKNLLFALERLRTIEGAVTFNIYGPIDDPHYWQSCLSAIAKAPPQHRIHYHGTLSHASVLGAFRQHDLFFMPTRGENFGHVILESLSVGTPVIISNQTPWRGLEAQHAGWDLSLDQPEGFCSALKQCVEMEESTYREWRHGARSYFESLDIIPDSIRQNRELFREWASVPDRRSSVEGTLP